jgi:hypothetical protein
MKLVWILRVNCVDTFTPEDAAVLLQREPFANIEARLDRTASRVFKCLDPPVHTPGRELEGGMQRGAGKNQFIITDVSDVKQRGAGKNQFIITDVSDVKNKEMFVRDMEGVLREASGAERYWQRHTQAKYMHNK